MSRLPAIKQVAKMHRRDHQTVMSACTRSLGIDTEELDEFLRRNAASEFCAHLVLRFPGYQDYINQFFLELSGQPHGKADEDIAHPLGTLFPDERKQLLKVLLLHETQECLSRWLERIDLPADIKTEMRELHEKVGVA